MSTDLTKEFLDNTRSIVHHHMNLARASMSLSDYKEAERQCIWDTLFPKFDLPISCDPTHLCKLPLSPHPDTLVLTRVLPDPGEWFDPQIDTKHIDEVGACYVQEQAAIIEKAIM